MTTKSSNETTISSEECRRCKGQGYTVEIEYHHRYPVDTKNIDCGWCFGKGTIVVNERQHHIKNKIAKLFTEIESKQRYVKKLERLLGRIHRRLNEDDISSDQAKRRAI